MPDVALGGTNNVTLARDHALRRVEWLRRRTQPYAQGRVLIFHGVVNQIDDEHGLAEIDFGGGALQWVDWGRPKFPPDKWLGKPVKVLLSLLNLSMWVDMRERDLE